MSRKHLIIVVICLILLVVGLSGYLWLRGQKPTSGVPLSQAENEAYAPLVGDPDLFVGRVLYTAEGFDPPRIGVIAPKPPVVLISNNSDARIQIENTEAPEGEEQIDVVVIAPGEVGQIWIGSEGRYLFVNQAGTNQQFEIEYRYKKRQAGSQLEDQLDSEFVSAYDTSTYALAQNRYTVTGFERGEIEISSPEPKAAIQIENLSDDEMVLEVSQTGADNVFEFRVASGEKDVFELSEYDGYVIRDVSNPEVNFFVVVLDESIE